MEGPFVHQPEGKHITHTHIYIYIHSHIMYTVYHYIYIIIYITWNPPKLDGLLKGWFLVFATLSFSASKTVWFFVVVVVVAIQGLELLKDQNPGAREDAAGDQRFWEFFGGWDSGDILYL